MEQQAPDLALNLSDLRRCPVQYDIGAYGYQE